MRRFYAILTMGEVGESLMLHEIAAIAAVAVLPLLGVIWGMVIYRMNRVDKKVESLWKKLDSLAETFMPREMCALLTKGQGEKISDLSSAIAQKTGKVINGALLERITKLEGAVLSLCKQVAEKK